jgi:hypothetical protein
MDAHGALELPDDHTEKELSDACWDMALDNADMYGYYPPSDDMDDDDEYVTEGIEGWAEVYDPEKHDMHRAGGGSFAGDF